jgi:O-succinylhomoserine sulfhydrylase
MRGDACVVGDAYSRAMSDHDHSQGSARRLATRAIRAGQVRTSEGEHGEPIFTTSSFVFASAAEAAARFSGAQPGNVYSRFTNPTVRAFEERLNSLEGGLRCIATASGMAAITAMTLALCKAGDHVVSSRAIFGASLQWFEQWLPRYGIEVTLVDLDDLAGWRAALSRPTRLVYLETPSNPLTELADIRAVADIAHAAGALLAVDNCFCTPILQLPFALGADLVIHSATKYLDGQGRLLGGAVLAREQALADTLFGFLRTAGPCMSAMNAWVFLKGLETLPLRMRAHSESALAVARWLEAQPSVSRVLYPFLESHPQHELARVQQSAGGGIVSFELPGGREQVWRFIDALGCFSITANLGDTRSTVTHPATTTHGRLSPEQRAAAGISENLVRLSVGLEAVEDLLEDLDAALRCCATAS